MLSVNGGYLWDNDRGRRIGRVDDRGPYGIRVLDDFNRSVGEIRNETMCGGSFLTFRRSSPSIFDQPSIFDRLSILDR